MQLVYQLTLGAPLQEASGALMHSASSSHRPFRLKQEPWLSSIRVAFIEAGNEINLSDALADVLGEVQLKTAPRSGAEIGVVLGQTRDNVGQKTSKKQLDQSRRTRFALKH